MKKNQVNSILINQTKRRNTVFTYIIIIVAVFFLAFLLFLLYNKVNKSQYVRYDETGNIDYTVHYKENDYFESNFLGSNRQYIASLIENINAVFNYKIALEDDNVEYKYSYGIEAQVIVKDKNNQNIFYDRSEILIPEKENMSSVNEVNITESLNIDYGKYNNQIKNLVNTYDLKTAESTLNINMYVNVVGSCEEFTNTPEKERVISLTIPLTEDTIAIDFVDDIVTSTNNVMKCTSSGFLNGIILFLALLLTGFGILLIIIVIRYEIKTRTAETIYEKELKKILNNYGNSIQVIGNEFEFKNYQLLKIETFYDLLEISDKLRQPILMRENKEKNGAYFVIPSVTKILYVHRIKVSDIKKEMTQKNIDVENNEEEILPNLKDKFIEIKDKIKELVQEKNNVKQQENVIENITSKDEEIEYLD